jgi:hypothetical protein
LQPFEVFSNSTLQRGKTHQFAEAGEPAGSEPGIWFENGATAVAPRSNKADEDITETPSNWPINQRRT